MTFLDTVRNSTEYEVRQGQGILGALLRFAGGVAGGGGRQEEVKEEVDGQNSTSIVSQALFFTVSTGRGLNLQESVNPTNANEDLDSSGTLLILGDQGTVYLSSLAHNLSLQTSPSSNGTRVAALFANYPPHLLDFAVFCCVAFIVLGVPANLITIIALVSCKKVHNATAVFIVNLTLSDLMLGVFNLPLAASLFVHRAWVHTGFLCMLFPFLRYGLVAVAVFTVLAITINRYVMIAHPKLYHKLYTQTLLAVMVVSTWVGAFGALVPTALKVWGTFGLDPTIGSCTILPDSDGYSPKSFLFVFAFMLPCVAICVCYARIFCIVHRADKRSHNSDQSIIRVNSKQDKQKGSTKQEEGGKLGVGEERDRADPHEGGEARVHTLSETVQVETQVKLTCNTSSVSVEVLEGGASPTHPASGHSDGRGQSPSPGVSVTVLRPEVNGLSGHPSGEEGVVSSPIRICPTNTPDSPASDATDETERRQSNESAKGAFSQLRGTFRRARRGSLLTRQTALSPKDQRLLKMILVIFLSFVVCYLPITLVKTFSKDDKPVLNILGLLLVYLTTCINPIIYVVMSSEYRQAYLSLFACSVGAEAVNRSLTKIS